MYSRKNVKKANVQINQIMQETALNTLRDALQNLNQDNKASNIKTKIEKIKKDLGALHKGQFKVDFNKEINNAIDKIDSNTPIPVVSALNIIGEIFNLGNKLATKKQNQNVTDFQILDYVIYYSKKYETSKSKLLKLKKYDQADNFLLSIPIERINKIITKAEESKFFNLELSQSERSIFEEPLIKAQENYKIYINLTNEGAFKIENLLCEKSLKKYSSQEIKSLFLRTETLELDRYLGEQIAKATYFGIKEIFIFCDQEKSQLTSKQFNEFLDNNNIRINFRISPLSQKDILKIQEDKVGKKDLLGFKELRSDKTLQSHYITYRNSFQLKLLNDNTSNEIILKNFENYKIQSKEESFAQVAEPVYTKSESTIEDTDILEEDLELGIEQSKELSANIDQDIDIDQSQEEEEEISVDTTQNMLDRRASLEMLEKMLKSFFHDFYLTKTPNQLVSPVIDSKITSINECSDETIYTKLLKNFQSFLSDFGIETVTEKALKIIAKNFLYFGEDIITTSNMPVGLVLKDGVIFASDKRPASMPINDFTIKFNDIFTQESNPLMFSVLPYATHGSITLEDIYHEDYGFEAPLIYGESTHPGIARAHTPHNGLDLPINRFYSEYTKSKNAGGREYADFNKDFSNTLSDFSLEVKSLDQAISNLQVALPNILKEIIDYNYPNLELSESDFNNYKYFMIDVFKMILTTNHFKNISFIYEKNTMVFLNKLVTEILPVNDSAKLDFFKKALSKKFSYLEYNIEKNFIGIKGVFEPINFHYKKLQDFIVKAEITQDKHQEVIDKFLNSLYEQLESSTNFRTSLESTWNIYDQTIDNGGNLLEQLENIANVFQPNKALKDAKKLGVNTLHESQGLYYVDSRDDVEVSNLKKQLHITEDYHSHKYQEIFNTAQAYLGSQYAHQRTDLNTYAQYFGDEVGSYKRVVYKDKFRTAEYIEAEEITNIDDLKKKSNGDLAKFTELLKTDAIREIEELPCDPDIFVKGSNSDLIEKFTIDQAYFNTILLNLNIISSTGKYYDREHPDRHFNSYISLFNLLFSELQVKERIKIATRKYKPGKDYNYNELIAKQEDEEIEFSENVQEKISVHRDMVNIFSDIFIENSEFNFDELAALGLVINCNQMQNADNSGISSLSSRVTSLSSALKSESSTLLIKNAKLLSTQYKTNFTRMLHILISSPISADTGLEELKNRAQSVENIINMLLNEITDKDGNKYILHELLTQNGKNPDNIEFFALYLDNKKTPSYSLVKELIDKLDNLESIDKDTLLNTYSKTKLPYKNGKIIESGYPTDLSLKNLNKSDIDDLTLELEKYSISEEELSTKTKFNNLGSFMLKNLPIDLSSLEDLYKIKIPEDLKQKNYNQLKQAIYKDKEFIKNKFLEGKSNKVKGQKIASDLLKLILGAIDSNNDNWKEERINKIVSLLFDNKKSLSKQILNIDFNQINLYKVFKKCPNEYEKKVILNNLSYFSNKKDILEKALEFLGKLDSAILQTKGINLSELLSNKTIKELIVERLDLFKLTTKLYLKADLNKDIKELYSLIYKISVIDNTTFSAKKILAYCIKNDDNSLLDIISNLNAKLDNISELVDYLTSLELSQITKLQDNTNLNLEKLLQLNSIKKIKLIIDVAIRLEKHISKDEYNKILTEVLKNDVQYTKLLHSYLVAPFKNIENLDKNIETISPKNFLNSIYNSIYSYFNPAKEEISEEETKDKKSSSESINVRTPHKIIEVVIKNLKNLENAQEMFSEYDLWRFKSNTDQIIERINNIKRKNVKKGNTDDLLSFETVEIFKSTMTVYEKIKSYRNINSNILHDRVLEIKHKRMSIKDDNDLEAIRTLDLEFLSIVCEMMYRTTGFFPRDTQILSAVNVIVHEELNLIEEIATGEGKSITTALIATHQWFTGQTVHVVTSAGDLALRDLKQFSPLYDSLDIPHSDIIIKADSPSESHKEFAINVFATGSDAALYIAGRNFYEEKPDLSLNTKISLVADEIDFMLTSPINYKLATSLLGINSAETRELFSYIFSFYNTMQNKDKDVSFKNFEQYIESQFRNYDPSYNLQLKIHQIEDLKSNSIHLYNLYHAYKVFEKHSNELFSVFINSLKVAQGLEEGKDFVMPSQDDMANGLLKAIPLVKKQPAKKVVFGKGIQVFLHLILEAKSEYSELKGKLDTLPPSDTIFNISPKNFFDHYIMALGRIIGLTGTAGDENELEIFRLKNKFLSWSIPRYKKYQGKETTEEVSNKQEQFSKTLDILRKKDPKQPILIFFDNPTEAEEFFKIHKSELKDDVQLYAASPKDTNAKVDIILENAGKDGTTTLTTSILGRGTDFKTLYKDGYLLINLCTEVTLNENNQIKGRVARNGNPGQIISYPNSEKFLGEDMDENMINRAVQEYEESSRKQPMNDVLSYFQEHSKGETLTAITYNTFIKQAWYDVLRKNKSDLESERKSYDDLRDELVKAVKDEYPKASDKLDDYLKELDEDIPEILQQTDIIGGICIDISKFDIPLYDKDPYATSKYQTSQYYLDITRGLLGVNLDILSKIVAPRFKRSIDQDMKISHVEQEPKLKSKIPFTKEILDIYKRTSLDNIVTPMTNYGSKDYDLYNIFYQYQAVVIATHALDITENKFNFPEIYHINSSKLKQEKLNRDEISIHVKNGKLYCQIKEKGEIEISKISETSHSLGISEETYKNILSHSHLLMSHFNDKQKQEILEFAKKKIALERIDPSKILIFSENDKLYCQITGKNKIEITKYSSSNNMGISQKIYDDIFTSFEISDYLSTEQKQEVLNFATKQIESQQIEKEEMRIFTEDGKLYCQVREKAKLEIIKSSNSITSVGISKKNYNDILTSIQNSSNTSNFKLNPKQKKTILDFAIKKNYINKTTIKGEGAGGDLMLSEFKKSFETYKKYLKSEKIQKISKLVDNFISVQDADINKIEKGSYQAFSVSTKFDNNAGHAETILTDGNMLFWINRGANVVNKDEKSGIRIFKIIKDIDRVKEILNSLKIPKSQIETSKEIYSLLREDSDTKVPKHTVIEMESQKIGNCGWVQVKSMLLALALVSKVGHLDELSSTTSSKWKNSVQDAYKIYLDFEKYDTIKRYEATLFSLDESFATKYLSDEEKQEINSRRKIIDNLSSHELIVKVTKTLQNDVEKIFSGTRYKLQADKILIGLKLEVAATSDFAALLESVYDENHVKNLLSKYQNLHSFENTDKLYTQITKNIATEELQAETLYSFIKYISENSYINNEEEFITKSTDIIQICNNNEQKLLECIGKQLPVGLSFFNINSDDTLI